LGYDEIEEAWLEADATHKKMTSKFLAILGVSTILLSGAFGQGKKAAMAAGPTCPVCHMSLSAKKTKDRPTAIRLKKGGKIQYCCAACVGKMPKSVLVKGK